MEHLPELVVDKLCQFLSARDVASCCAASRSWRSVFNQDSVWRPFCDPGLATHLKNSETRVEPIFRSPERRYSSLSPNCQWRLSYMREVHLWNNWRQGRFITDTFGKVRANGRYPFVKFLRNNHVIMKLQNERDVMLWEVRGVPYHVGNPATLELYKNIDLCEVVDDSTIIFLQLNVIQMFSIDCLRGKWTPLGIYHLSPLVEAVRMAFVSENKLIAVRRDDFVEVFDMNAFDILEKSSLPVQTNDSVFVNDVVLPGKLSRHFAVVLESKTSGNNEHVLDAFIVYIYRVDKLAFLEFKITNPVRDDYKDEFCCVIHDNFIAIINAGFLSIYNYLTSEVIFRGSKPFTDFTEESVYLGFDTVDLISNSLVAVRRKVKRNKKTLTLFLEKQCSNIVPIACQCLRRQQCALDRLIGHAGSDNRGPTCIDSIMIVNRHPRLEINQVYTKYLNKKGPHLITYW